MYNFHGCFLCLTLATTAGLSAWPSFEKPMQLVFLMMMFYLATFEHGNWFLTYFMLD